MSRIQYKGFEISPATVQLAENGEWSLEVVITKHHDQRNETLSSNYSASNTFATKQEAEQAAVEFGKRIIDGSIPELSVSSLS